MDKKVLLIADDEEMNRKIISRFLKTDYDVLMAADGDEALEILSTHHVDVLLLDIIMPKLDGLEVLKQLRTNEQYASLGVLVATSVKEKTERMALSIGADDVVSKPYDPLVIKRRLENILAAKELSRQKQLQETGDYDTLLRERMQQLNREAATACERISSCADIINANKDNYNLVAEMVTEIKAETHKYIEHMATES